MARADMEQALDDALAQLTIRDRLRVRRLKFRRAAGALILQLEGEEPAVRGWPRRFHERYRGVLPLNCPDELPEEETQEQQVVTELLAIAQGCGYDGRPAYRLPISFPRFAAAFAALYVWRPDDGQLPAKQNSKIARMVKQAIAEERRYTLQEMKERAEALARDEQVAQRLLSWAPWDRADGCGERLLMRGADCVGVSDGTGVFMPRVQGMREVFAGIEAENERIERKAHATVALMIPMESDNAAVRRQIVSEVQGAYLGQLQANGSDAAPPIRLVLANPGRDYRAWRYTVDRLVDQEPELRMVVGFNLSLDNTQDAMRHLTGDLKIPVVAGLVTSQAFANTDGPGPYRYPGLARVVSTSKDQVAALLHYDPGLARAQTALVADTRPGDSYNKSLRDAFTEARGAGAGAQDMTFTSEGPETAGVTPNEFETFAMNLCESKARVVYFAGRAFHLELFVQKLARTYCARKTSYTVITGSDATSLDERLGGDERALLRGDPKAGTPTINVLYAAPAHPDAWNVELERWKKRAGKKGADPGNQPRYLVEPQRAMEQLRAEARAHEGKLGRVRLDDGRAIETHDVILTAAKALTKAAATTRTPVPSQERIKEDYENLNSAFRIQGAGGWICLTNAGNPYNKALAIVRLDPMRTKLTFDALAWPKGTPAQDDRCVVPQKPA